MEILARVLQKDGTIIEIYSESALIAVLSTPKIKRQEVGFVNGHLPPSELTPEQLQEYEDGRRIQEEAESEKRISTREYVMRFLKDGPMSVLDVRSLFDQVRPDLKSFKSVEVAAKKLGVHKRLGMWALEQHKHLLP